MFRFGFVPVLLLAWATALRAADDVVIVSAGGGGTTRVTGRIVDYTGQGLLIERLGRQEQIDARRVIDVQSQWSDKHREADRLRALGQYAEAGEQYRMAIRDETRDWVRRRLLADLVVCHANTGEIALAGDFFLRLTANDPATPYFDTIPLNWQTTQPDAAVASQSRGWLRDSQSPAARLLGASWLLSTTDRGAAIAALNELTNNSDPRVALLAESQLWRTRLVQATESDVGLWKQRIEQMPRGLQAGPTFVVGQGLARLRQSEQAALVLMRVAILHPDQRELAAASLTLAARQLENLQQPTDAARLYREVITKHDASRHAQEAEARLQTLVERKP